MIEKHNNSPWLKGRFYNVRLERAKAINQELQNEKIKRELEKK